MYTHANVQLLGGGGEVDESVPTRTLITFDKGALWEPLKAPEKDTSGNKPCDGCTLHLNGKTSHTFGPVYRCYTCLCTVCYACLSMLLYLSIIFVL
jgi:hypothetical protein